MKTISQTRSYCKKCAVFHEAFYRQEGNNVFFTVDCPQGAFKHLVSDDAALFKAIRVKAGFGHLPDVPPKLKGKKRFHMLGITNRCNFKCNICYASSNTEQDILQLTPDEIFRLAPKVKKAGGRFLTLTGGEPTLHPDLFTIIKGLKQRGLAVSMSTNGYRVGTEQNFAARLRASGLNIITFSFDTLKKEIQKLYRNNSYITEKMQALKNARAAGLRISTISTVSDYNVRETGDIIHYLAGYAPALSFIILQPYFCSVNPRDANTIFNAEKVVKRERIINELVASGAIDGLSQDHFWPFPQLSLAIHPDCGAIATLACIRGEIAPLDSLLDIRKYYSLINAGGNKTRPALIPLLQLRSALKSARKGKLLQILKCFYGFISGKGNHSLLVILVEGFMDSAYQDEERVRRCTSLVWEKEGKLDHHGCLSSYGMQQ